MQAWSSFWAIFLVIGLAAFAVVAVAVTIGGYRDLRSMFARMREERRSGE